ncbi:unnamed protein product, partial [Prorocentrum cordatum]
CNEEAAEGRGDSTSGQGQTVDQARESCTQSRAPVGGADVLAKNAQDRGDGNCSQPELSSDSQGRGQGSQARSSRAADLFRRSARFRSLSGRGLLPARTQEIQRSWSETEEYDGARGRDR